MRAERYEAWIWGLCAFAYVYVFPYQSSLNNPNENVRFYMTAALVDSHSYAIDEQRERWGWVNDAAVHGGHVYSVKAPGTSFLGVPGYALYKLSGRAFDRSEALWVCRVTGTILPTLWGVWVFVLFLRRRELVLSLRLATSIAVWLGSLLYGYGMLFVSHTLSAVVAFAAFAFLYEVQQGERVASPLAATKFGLLAAATTWFEYPGLVASAVLLAYALVVLRSWQLRLAWLCGGILPALLMMHFQYHAFGSPFTPGHLFVENDSFRAAHEQGLYGAVGVSPRALYGLLLDPGAGLFLLTPLLWFALPGLWLQLRERGTRAAAITSAALFVLTCLAISAMNNWRGGWTIGPRYLAVCVPFLAFPALHALDRLARRAPRLAAGLGIGTAAASLVASGIPSAYYPHLPPELTRPLPQLFSVLIAHDFAPPNLGNWFGVWGTASLLPLFAAGLAALGLCAHAAVRGANGSSSPDTLAGGEGARAGAAARSSRPDTLAGGEGARAGAAARSSRPDTFAGGEGARAGAAARSSRPDTLAGGEGARAGAAARSSTSATEREAPARSLPDAVSGSSPAAHSLPDAASGSSAAPRSLPDAVSGSSTAPRVLAQVSAIALLSAGLCLAPLYWRPRSEPGVAKAVAFVTGRFQPSGHDRAARLRAQLSAAGANAHPRQWRELERVYRREGREKEAKRAAQHEL